MTRCASPLAASKRTASRSHDSADAALVRQRVRVAKVEEIVGVLRRVLAPRA